METWTFLALNISKLALLTAPTVLPEKKIMLVSVTKLVILDTTELVLFVGLIHLKDGVVVEWVLLKTAKFAQR